MKVEILNKAMSVATYNVITTFLIHDFPKCLLAEINTHRSLSRNWESARARPVGAVIEQVMIDPYIPNFTGRAKGMQGVIVSNEVGDRARYRWLNARDNAVNAAQEMIAIGIHKQDANRLLEPWMKVSGIVTATEWDNFYKLRNHPDTQPAFQEFAAEMQRLDETTEAKPLDLGEWYKPWPDLNLAANVCKAASVSYANHAKDRTDEDFLRIHDDLINATPVHASPLEHCAIAVEPGMIIHKSQFPFGEIIHEKPSDDYSYSLQVFDPISIGGSVGNRDGADNWASTANFSGFLQYRKILEAGLKVDIKTEAVQ